MSEQTIVQNCSLFLAFRAKRARIAKSQARRFPKFYRRTKQKRAK
jgi:hypothetical protein